MLSYILVSFSVFTFCLELSLISMDCDPKISLNLFVNTNSFYQFRQKTWAGTSKSMIRKKANKHLKRCSASLAIKYKHKWSRTATHPGRWGSYDKQTNIKMKNTHRQLPVLVRKWSVRHCHFGGSTQTFWKSDLAVFIKVD